MIKKILKYSLVFLLLTMVSIISDECKKDKQHDNIPYAPINIYIKPNSTQYMEINSVGGWVYVYADPPSEGIIIYRFTTDEFKAYERTCPYDPLQPCAKGPVKVEKSGVTAVDSCCMSRFLLMDGTPFAGPSSLSLRAYQTYFDGNYLHIYN